MIHDIEAKVTKKIRLTHDVFALTFSCPDIARDVHPGTFLHILTEGMTLRRPVSVCDADDNSVTVVFRVKGQGTKEMSELAAGDTADILGPLGNGFEVSQYGHPLLIGGGIGVPPLYLLAKTHKNCDAILGFSSSQDIILLDEFTSVCKNVTLMTDDGSAGAKGFVTSPLQKALESKKYDCVCAVGPVAMFKGIKSLCDGVIPCYISLEERMGCGVGACLCCVSKIKRAGSETYLRVCKDGPVFDSTEVVFDG